MGSPDLTKASVPDTWYKIPTVATLLLTTRPFRAIALCRPWFGNTFGRWCYY
jgi:hypothetical protein